jgi:hypothetical protein
LHFGSNAAEENHDGVNYPTMDKLKARMDKIQSRRQSRQANDMNTGAGGGAEAGAGAVAAGDDNTHVNGEAAAATNENNNNNNNHNNNNHHNNLPSKTVGKPNAAKKK